MIVQITRTISLISHCGWVLLSNGGGLAMWLESRTTAKGVVRDLAGAPFVVTLSK